MRHARDGTDGRVHQPGVPPRGVGPAVDLPRHQVAVQRRDDRRHRPGDDQPTPLCRELAVPRLPVNFTSGMTGNESCRLRTTWLRISNLLAPWSPVNEMTITAGTIASEA